MSNPGPPGEDERPLAGPDTGMGLPESGTQHATSTDFDPLAPATTPIDPPLTTGLSGDEPAPPVTPSPEIAGTVPSETLPTTSSYGTASGSGGSSSAGGALAKVKAFAEQRPEAFLAAALAAGWLAGKLLGSSSDDDSEDGR
jgi:hypothetical protein